MDLKSVLPMIEFSTETLIDQEVDRSLICSICQEILKNPKECSNCQNCFCKKCIESWKISNDSCPFRCSELQLKNPHKVVMETLKKLNFKCRNFTNGCNEHLNYTNYINHMETCIYSKNKCVMNDCNTEVFLKDMHDHLYNHCEYKVHSCEKCGFLNYGTNKLYHNCMIYAKSLISDMRYKYFDYVNNADKRLNVVGDKIKILKELISSEEFK